LKEDSEQALKNDSEQECTIVKTSILAKELSVYTISEMKTSWPNLVAVNVLSAGQQARLMFITALLKPQAHYDTVPLQAVGDEATYYHMGHGREGGEDWQDLCVTVS
jgi:hypothetical protein